MLLTVLKSSFPSEHCMFLENNIHVLVLLCLASGDVVISLVG